MIEIKIDDDISFQEYHSDMYPFGKMKINQSFAVDAAKKSKMRNALKSYKDKHPEVKFATRTMNDNTVRVWRLA